MCKLNIKQKKLCFDVFFLHTKCFMFKCQNYVLLYLKLKTIFNIYTNKYMCLSCSSTRVCYLLMEKYI